MNKKILSNKSVLLIATMLSTMMLATSSMASLVPTTAFAQEDASSDVDSGEVAVGEGDVEVDPIIQTNVGVDVNTNVDTAVVTDEEDCEEASNDVTQEISQPSDQEASRDVEQGEGSLYVNPVVQTNAQVGFNTNVDYDVILVDGCQPEDNVSQGTLQDSNQQANRDIEAGAGSDQLLPTFQRSDQIAQNRQINEDILIEAPLPQ
jgi:hypothetical protein